MLLIVVVIAVEANRAAARTTARYRLGVMIVAFVGLLANLFVAFLLGRGERNLNTRAGPDSRRRRPRRIGRRDHGGSSDLLHRLATHRRSAVSCHRGS